MDDAGKRLAHDEPESAAHEPQLSDEERQVRERALLVEKLALRVLDECRVSLMLSFRYLDIALWKLPFVARQQNSALATDGMSLFFNPDLVVLRFKASPNELIRDYLQVILHCVLRHPFETSRRQPETWSIACDMCVEAIAMEMCESLYPCAEDELRADGLRMLRREVDVITPARVYGTLVDAAQTSVYEHMPAAGDGSKVAAGPQLAASSLGKRAWKLEDPLSFMQSISEMRPLFWRDDHEPWNLLKLSDEPDDTPSQDNSSGTPGDGDDGEGDEGGQPEEEPQKAAEEGQEGQDSENEGDEEGEGDTRADGDSDSADSEDDEHDDGSDSSGDAGSGAGDDRPDAGPDEEDREGEGEPPEGAEPGEEENADREGAQSDSPAANQQEGSPAVAASAASEAEDDESDETAQGQAFEFSPAAADADQADIYGYIEKDPQELVDLARLSEVEWSDISKRIEADLKTMSSMRGYETGTFMANLALANRSRIDYADFLRRFSTAVEDAHMNEDEFDYIYYMYGLNRYGNMPLVEPLESRETFRIRDFVIALDTSGSTTGELERLFVTRTLELLKQSAHRGEEVNIHIVQCDSQIRKVTVITDIQQLDAYEESVEVYGMGGTDFRPVFAYVDDLKQEGHFSNLRGLLYFTDGMGIFPASPPSYDTAFVFLEDEGKEMKVPPWAMRVVLDEDMIREW